VSAKPHGVGSIVSEMSPLSYLYVVASRHPRVGKTLIAPLLFDFLRLTGRQAVG